MKPTNILEKMEGVWKEVWREVGEARREVWREIWREVWREVWRGVTVEVIEGARKEVEENEEK